MVNPMWRIDNTTQKPGKGRSDRARRRACRPSLEPAQRLEPRVLLDAGSFQLVPEASDSWVHLTSDGDQQTGTSYAQAVGRDAAGNLVVVWTSGDSTGKNLYARRFSADGAPLSGEIPVNINTTTNKEGATVAVAPDGDFVVIWSSSQQSPDTGLGVFARMFQADGTPKTGEFRVNHQWIDNQRFGEAVITPSGGFAVTWFDQRQKRNVFLRIYDNAGSPLTGEIKVTQTDGTTNRVPGLAIGGDGNLMVVWNSPEDGDSSGVFARRFDTTGNPLGDVFQVNQQTAGNQTHPAIAARPSGGYLVTWTSDGQDGDGQAVVGRFFDNNGNPEGDEFVLNAEIAGNQSVPRPAIGPAGGFLVVWQSDGPGADGLDIIARSFSADGTPQSGDTRLNATTAGDQRFPVVAAAVADVFLAAWTTPDDSGLGVATNWVRLWHGPTTTGPFDQSVLEGTPEVIVDPSAFFTDPDDLPSNLTYSLVSTTATPDDLATISWRNGVIHISPRPFASGSFTATIRATDPLGMWVETSYTLTVLPVNDPPIAGDDTFDLDADTTLTVAAPGLVDNDEDPDGDPLTVLLEQLPTHGSLILHEDGSFEYTPEPGFIGLDTFQYRLDDGQALGNPATVTLNVRVVPPPPLARDVTLTGTQGQTVAFPTTQLLASSVAPADQVLVEIVQAPRHGQVLGWANGMIVYLPAAGYTGPDSFTFRLFDGVQYSNVAVVSIDVTPDAPTETSAPVNPESDPRTAPGPRVVAVRRYGVRRQWKFLQVQFDQDLDPDSATAPRNYRLIHAGLDRRLGTCDDKRVRLRRFQYDAESRTVTFRARRLPLGAGNRYALRIRGASSDGLANPQGVSLNSPSAGTPGRSTVVRFSREALAGPATHSGPILFSEAIERHRFQT
jgi:hypothetical protein